MNPSINTSDPRVKADLVTMDKEFSTYGRNMTLSAMSLFEGMDPDVGTRIREKAQGEERPRNDAAGLGDLLPDTLHGGYIKWLDLPAVPNSIPVLRNKRWGPNEKSVQTLGRLAKPYGSDPDILVLEHGAAVNRDVVTRALSEGKYVLVNYPAGVLPESSIRIDAHTTRPNPYRYIGMPAEGQEQLDRSLSQYQYEVLLETGELIEDKNEEERSGGDDEGDGEEGEEGVQPDNGFSYRSLSYEELVTTERDPLRFYNQLDVNTFGQVERPEIIRECADDRRGMYFTMDEEFVRQDALRYAQWSLQTHSFTLTDAHHDSSGFATYVHVTQGVKLWFYYKRSASTTRDQWEQIVNGRFRYASLEWDKKPSWADKKGEYLNVKKYEAGKGTEPGKRLGQWYCIMLRPNQLLIQPPEALHVVYNPVASVSFGGHFLPFRCLKLCADSRYTDCKAMDEPSNDTHPAIHQVLRGMALSLDDGEGDLADPDVPAECLAALYEMLHHPEKFDATLWKRVYVETWGKERYDSLRVPMEDLHRHKSLDVAAKLLTLCEGDIVPLAESLWPSFVPKVLKR